VTGRADVHVEQVGVVHRTAAGVVQALDGVTLDVPGGTRVAVVGPSGCGKSTLLGLLGGLDVPTTGSVRVGAEVVSALGDRERAAFRRANVGYVYQNDNLLPFLTVEENLAFQLALNSDGVAEQADVGRRLLARLGLDALAQRVPDRCRAASASAWRSPGPSSTGLGCCWPTNRPVRWTPATPPSSSTCCWRSGRTSAPPWWWPPTTGRRPPGWGASSNCATGR
jgi:ABC-type glutathione transport system ATPase component